MASAAAFASARSRAATASSSCCRRSLPAFVPPSVRRPAFLFGLNTLRCSASFFGYPRPLLSQFSASACSISFVSLPQRVVQLLPFLSPRLLQRLRSSSSSVSVNRLRNDGASLWLEVLFRRSVSQSRSLFDYCICNRYFGGGAGSSALDNSSRMSCGFDGAEGVAATGFGRCLGAWLLNRCGLGCSLLSKNSVPILINLGALGVFGLWGLLYIGAFTTSCGKRECKNGYKSRCIWRETTHRPYLQVRIRMRWAEHNLKNNELPSAW